MAEQAEVALVDGRNAEQRRQEPAAKECADDAGDDVQDNALSPIGPHQQAGQPAEQATHHWARRLRAKWLDAPLIAANFATPYRMEGRSGKNDATDAAAICEAASRPSMRFVPVKTPEQQGIMSLHRIREGHRLRQPHPGGGVHPIAYVTDANTPNNVGPLRSVTDGKPCASRPTSGLSGHVFVGAYVKSPLSRPFNAVGVRRYDRADA